MIEDWSTATKASGSSFSAKPTASDSIVYVNGDGGARKNQWIWAVPAESYALKDYEDENYYWWYADNSGKVVKNKLKKIKGKVYAFDEDGRMLSGLVSTTTGRDGFTNDSGDGDHDYQDLTADQYLANPHVTASTKIFYFSDDYSKDGSRKTGYQKVDFEDDTYEMYFNNNGEAANDYVTKIKKYANKGIILKANNDDSNYGAIDVNVSTKKLNGNTSVVYYGQSGFNTGLVLINTAGTVQTKKLNLKDSNDIYYLTDSNGVIKYAGEKKLYKSGTGDHKHSIGVIDGTEYFTE
jgi:hypothetical protein